MRRLRPDLPSTLVAVAVALVVTGSLTLTAGPDGSPALAPPILDGADWGIPPGEGSVEAADVQREAFASLAGLVLVLGGAAAGIAFLTALALEVGCGSRRRRHVAVRAALGAAPRTLLRETLALRVRPLLLVGLGGASAVGVLLAVLLAVTWPGPSTPKLPSLPALLPALGAALALVGAALLPLRHARGRLSGTLGAGASTTDPYEGGLRRVASVLQLAAALAILAGVGSALRAPTPGGKDTESGASLGEETLLIPVRLDGAANPTTRDVAWQALLERARRHPSLVAESVATPGAWSGLGRRDFVVTECLCARGLSFLPLLRAEVYHHVVSPDFFQQAGLSLLDGRTFDEGDDSEAERVAVVSRSLAEEAFRDGDPVGLRVRIGPGEAGWHTVVGVVGEAPGVALGRSAGEAPAVYLAALQHPPDRVDLALNGDFEAESADSIVIALGLRDGSAARLVGEPLSVRSLRRRDRAPLMWFGWAAAFAAGLGLLAGLVGSWAVAEVEVRAGKKGLGVRAALGASPRMLFRHVLGRSGRGAALAVLLALPGAVGVAGYLRATAGSVPLVDASLFVALALLLVAAALLGALGPARQAARSDPARILASE